MSTNMTVELGTGGYWATSPIDPPPGPMRRKRLPKIRLSYGGTGHLLHKPQRMMVQVEVGKNSTITFDGTRAELMAFAHEFAHVVEKGEE